MFFLPKVHASVLLIHNILLPSVTENPTWHLHFVYQPDLQECHFWFPGLLSIMSVMRKEMEKYRDIDEDELLKKLSEEELQRLEDELEELDPDVSL